jgi:hypothetical protein
MDQPQQLRELSDVRRDPQGLVAGEQLGRGAASRLLLEIDVGECLPVLISGDETIQGGGKRRAVGME